MVEPFARTRGLLARGTIFATWLCASLGLGACKAPAPAPARPDGTDARDASGGGGNGTELGAAPLPSEGKRLAFTGLLRQVADPSLELDPKLTPGKAGGGITRAQYSIASTPSRRATGTLLLPAKSAGKLPVVIALHNTGGASTAGFLDDFINHPAGPFIGVAVSGPYYEGGGPDAYAKAMVDAYAAPGRSFPFLFDTVWDVMRTIDYLVTRADVDPSRIGIVGFSKGGMEVFLAAAADPRIAAAAPVIGVSSFKWALENDQWQARAGALLGAPEGAAATDGSTVDAAFMRRFYSRVSPGLVDSFDGPDMLPLIAPRPLRVLNGLTDPRNPIAGVELAIDAAEAAYAGMGAADKLSFVTEDVGHDAAPFLVPAREWLLQWLGKPAPSP